MTRQNRYLEAVIFDYDGTLVHLNIDFEAMRQGVEEVMIEYGIEPGELRGLYILETIDGATKLISEQNPREGASFYQKAIALVTEHEIRAAREGKILPGVMRMLTVLKARGVKVGVITRNCDRAVKMVFPNIEDFCHVYIPRDEVKGVKPDPDHLALAVQKLGVNNTERCLMVGDHVLDIEVGKRMKMKTAGVLTGKTTHRHFVESGADYTLDDATKILDGLFKEPSS